MRTRRGGIAHICADESPQNVHRRTLACAQHNHAYTHARKRAPPPAPTRPQKHGPTRKHVNMLARAERDRRRTQARASTNLRDSDRVELLRTARMLRVPALLRQLLLAAPVVRIIKMMSGQRRVSTVKKHAGAPLLAPRAPSLVRTHTPEANGRTLRNTRHICALIWPSLRKDRSVLCVQHGLGGEVGGLACVGVCSLRAQRTARMECKKEQ